jgi:hypothetical protein
VLTEQHQGADGGRQQNELLADRVDGADVHHDRGDRVSRAAQ